MVSKTKLERLEREVAKRTPAEPVVLRFVWRDEATGEEEQFGEAVVDSAGSRIISLKWPEDEDDEKGTRDVAPGRA